MAEDKEDVSKVSPAGLIKSIKDAYASQLSLTERLDEASPRYDPEFARYAEEKHRIESQLYEQIGDLRQSRNNWKFFALILLCFIFAAIFIWPHPVPVLHLAVRRSP